MIAKTDTLRPSTHSRLRQTNILFALSRQEQEIFLPQFSITGAFAETICHWPGTLPAKSDRTGWCALLDEIQPTIIVSAWRTPAIPQEWILGNGDNGTCSLRYICHLTGSVRQKVPRIFLQHGGLVTNWGGQVAAQVAEHALLLALSALRRSPAWLGMASVSSAGKIGVINSGTRTLFHRRIGIHGCGGVARMLASLLKPFGGEISCFSAGVPDEVIRSAGMRPAASLTELFSGKEILFECEALTPANHRCVNADTLAQLPSGALFVNVARGKLVDEAALYHEVHSGRIQAALDVLVTEPVPADSPWRTLHGAIYSPHIAGPTTDMMPRIGSMAMQNISNYLTGLPLQNLVTLEQYDRAT